MQQLGYSAICMASRNYCWNRLARPKKVDESHQTTFRANKMVSGSGLKTRLDRSLLFVMNVQQSKVIYMPLVQRNITSDVSHYSLELLKEGDTLVLIKGTMLHTPFEHI